MSWLLPLISGSAWFDVAVKSTAVVLMAAVLAALLRRASAAWRHLVWCLSVASLLFMPILALLLPDWRVAWLPRWTGQPAQLAAMEHIVLPQAERTQPVDDKKIILPRVAAASKTETHQESYHLQSVTLETLSPPRATVPWLTIAWAAGGLLSLVPLAIGLWQLFGLHRRSHAIDDRRWLTLLDELRRRLSVRRRVQLRQCQSAVTPLTWGALRPVLLLPSAAYKWPDERRRLVLLHELAHVLRWDWLTQLIAHVACAVYWYNPLVWWAARQMRIERERACDDIVLASGARASDYARELLALAMGLSHSQVSTLAAAPMARRALLDARLRGILDSRRSRSPLTRAAFCLGAVLAAVAITPLAMLRAAPPESNEMEAVETGEPTTAPAIRSISVRQQQLEKADEPKPPALGDVRVNEVWNLTLENRPHSHNRLPEGDMESLPRMWKAGWRLFQHSQPNVLGSGELSVGQHHAGKASFHLSVKPRDEDAPSPVIETAPLWLSSPALSVEAGQWVRIHGWVNIPQPIAGSLDGLLIIESLGREAQAERIGATNGWQEFTLYRAAPAACGLTVTFALSGLGDAWIDDVTVKLVAPPGSVTRQMENEDDGPRPPELGNPEVQEIWDLTLQEAVRITLANSKTFRNMGGLLVTPVAPQSKGNFGGGLLGAKRRGRHLEPIGDTKVGFVLARTDDDMTLADFKAGVRAMLSDVERAYWDLYFNYRNLNAVQAGRDSALANWRKVHALYVAGSKSGEEENERQAREQYFLFRGQVENTLGLLYAAESRLRYMMGVAPTDRRLIRPTDEPTAAEVRFEVKEILAEALNGGVERSHEQEAEFVQLLTNAVRDLDRNYQVSITTGNRRETASKKLQAVQPAYDAGTATLDTLLDAQRRLADAEIAYWRALVDYNVAIMQVHYRKNTLLEYNGILLTEGSRADTDIREK